MTRPWCPAFLGKQPGPSWGGRGACWSPAVSKYDQRAPLRTPLPLWSWRSVFHHPGRSLLRVGEGPPLPTSCSFGGTSLTHVHRAACLPQSPGGRAVTHADASSKLEIHWAACGPTAGKGQPVTNVCMQRCCPERAREGGCTESILVLCLGVGGGGADCKATVSHDVCVHLLIGLNKAQS